MHPIRGGHVTYPFGARNPRYAHGFHTGDDYACGSGTHVLAAWDGRVVYAGWGSGAWGSAYGNQVILESQHRGVKVRHAYNHLMAIGVHSGLQLAEGDFIGKSGATGFVTGAHLHYEERTSPFGYDDRVRDPYFNKHTLERHERINPASHGDVYVDRLQFRQQDSSSVQKLCFRLMQHNKMPSSHRPPHLVKNYTDEVRDAVRYWQRNIAPNNLGGADVKDGSRVTNRQANFLFGDSYRVIETWND